MNCFRTNQYALADSSGRCHQCGTSSLSELPIDMIKVFTLDFMHLVCLGVTRRMLYYLKGHYKGIFEGRLSSVQIQEILNSLMLLKFRGGYRGGAMVPWHHLKYRPKINDYLFWQ